MKFRKHIHKYLHRHPHFIQYGAYGFCIGVSILGLAITSTSSSHSIASTNHFKAPQIRTSSYVPRQYHNRFHPKRSFSYTVPYRVKSARNMVIRQLKPNYPIWNAPYTKGITYNSTTTNLANNSQPVELNKKADNNAHTYYEIVSGGHIYGWIPAAALKPINGVYKLPFHYYSQLYPTYAPDACEAVALRMALSVKGHDPHISMKKFIERVPRDNNHNPDNGYNASPFKYGDSASIYPPALARYGRRYDIHTQDVTGITLKQIISEIKHGNPIIFEGSYLMHDSTSDHTLILVGYSENDNYFEFADPFHRKSDKNAPISYVSAEKFGKIFSAYRRGLRAVVVK